MPPLVYALLIAHFVADFVCQTDWMALNKATRVDALSLHVATYAMWCLLPVALWQAADGVQAATWVLVNAGAHFVQDAVTSRMTSRLFPWQPIRLIDVPGSANIGDFAGKGWMVPKDGGSRHWFFVVIGADQLLHYVTLLATAEWWLR